MKRSTVIVVAVVVLVIAGVMLWSSRKVEMPTDAVVTSPQATTSESVIDAPKLRGSATLAELRQQGADLECSVWFDGTAQGSRIEGTYFVSEGALRGDFLTDAPDLSGQILSSLIVKDTMMYSWSEIAGEYYGVKIDLEENPAATVAGVVSLDTRVAYDCKPWPNVDRSVFEPPSQVLFRDQAQLMQAGMEDAVLYEEREEVVPLGE